jgi:hypothetical protein
VVADRVVSNVQEQATAPRAWRREGGSRRTGQKYRRPYVVYGKRKKP